MAYVVALQIMRRSILIALDKVVTQRSNDMDEHDRGKHIGENHVRLLDPLPHRPIHCGNQRRHVDFEQVFGHGNAERRRDHSTRQRDNEHQDIEAGVREGARQHTPTAGDRRQVPATG